jgi:hypothetical protein
MGFFQALPAILRFFQCCRRYYNSGMWFPHLVNSGKYLFTILQFAVLSIWRIDPTNDSAKAAFIACASINSVYSSMDPAYLLKKRLLTDYSNMGCCNGLVFAGSICEPTIPQETSWIQTGLAILPSPFHQSHHPLRLVLLHHLWKATPAFCSAEFLDSSS